MLYLVIGLFVAVAVGIFLRQQNNNNNNSGDSAEQNLNSNAQNDNGENNNDDDENKKIVLTAKPVTDAAKASGATYSSAAPAGDESPYGYSDKSEKKKAVSNLLRWCGRTGFIQVNNFVVQAPVTYWSNGESSTPEPSCIDITLPVAFPSEGDEIPKNEVASYAEMDPLQRGIYLTWLAGGRIRVPDHVCYPLIWLCGIERRAIVDKLDLGICIADAFKLLHLMRWEAMRDNLIRFITWLAVKIWLPDDDLLALCKRMNTVPEGMLCIMLSSYANSKLPLPSATAFTLMRTSEKLHEPGEKKIPYSDELLQKFTPIYKELCSGGIILSKPKNTMTISYVPSNPTIEPDKKSSTIEILNFFDNLEPFQPLKDAWHVFLSGLEESYEERIVNEIVTEDRPDFEKFIDDIRAKNEKEDDPLISTFGELGELLQIKTELNSERKIKGRERKIMVDSAQVEGWQIYPDLGISGREYLWDEKILFIPLEQGAKLSAEYRIASFVLEFICALAFAREERLFEPLRQRLNDYFKLSDDDNLRLEAQRALNLPTEHEPEYYGEFLCAWLSEDERKKLKGMMIHAASLLPEFADNPEVNSILCEMLKLREDEPPSAEDLHKNAKQWGSEVLTLMTLLFKSN